MSNRTLIQIHTTAIIKGLYERAMSLNTLDHKVTKGELRELFVSEILEQFLTDQFGIGTGVVINQAGMQSAQIDIIIYDKRVLPPLIKNKQIGIYPIESVLALIEVKSNLRKSDIEKSEDNFSYVLRKICHLDYSYDARKYKKTGKSHIYRPVCGLIGFYGKGVAKLRTSDGSDWLLENAEHIHAVCLMKSYSWVILKNKWRFTPHDHDTFEETKRFIAIMLDNIRTRSTKFPYRLEDKHKDWLSIYTRDQEKIRKYFERNSQDI